MQQLFKFRFGKDVRWRLLPRAADGFGIEPRSVWVEGGQVLREVANHRIAPCWHGRARDGDSRGERSRQLFGQRAFITALMTITIERAEHLLLFIEAKTQLALQLDETYKVLGENTVQFAHSAPPGKGSATPAKLFWSTLV